MKRFASRRPDRRSRSTRLVAGLATLMVLAVTAPPVPAQRVDSERLPAGEAQAIRKLMRELEERQQRGKAPGPTPQMPPATVEAGADPLAALAAGSGRGARDPMADGRACGSCPEMVVVPSGSFQMGTSPSEIAALTRELPPGATAFTWEGPEQRVAIAQPFAVGRNLVTRGAFAAFVSASGHRPARGCVHYADSSKTDPAKDWQSPGFPQTDAHPVVCVDWDDAVAYVRWLARQTGKPYRLASEAEVEYVTRATTRAEPQGRYFFGSNPRDLCAYANGADRALSARHKLASMVFTPCSDGFVFTSPVGSLKPNSWGLHDVYGNAMIWTADCWRDSHVANPGDGSPRTSGTCSQRVVRGSPWNAGPHFLRAGTRGPYAPNTRLTNLGIRVARSLAP